MLPVTLCTDLGPFASIDWQVHYTRDATSIPCALCNVERRHRGPVYPSDSMVWSRSVFIMPTTLS